MTPPPRPWADYWTPSDSMLLKRVAEEYTSECDGPYMPWRKIMSHFPDRSQAAVRNRWMRMTNNHTPPDKTRQMCATCGQARRGHTCAGGWHPILHLASLEQTALVLSGFQALSERGLGKRKREWGEGDPRFHDESPRAVAREMGLLDE